MRRASWPVLLMMAYGWVTGCAAETATQASIGRELYAARCALCHDHDGAIGVHIDAPIIRAYKTAQALYNYTKFAMPYDAPRSLSDAEYWALTAHLLRSRGLFEGDTELGPENAPGIEWSGPGQP